MPYESSSYFVTHTWVHNANLVTESWIGDAGANDVRTTEGFQIYMRRTNSNYQSDYLWATIGKLP